MVAGLPPKRDRLQGEFNPAWEPKIRAKRPDIVSETGHCIVIGSGLAGAAVASSLARRGWRVSVLDAGNAPAAGASGLPAGLVVEHVSTDDAVVSRLSRAGVRITWQQVQRLLREGQDYALSGVRERCLEQGASDLWHARAGWIKTAQFVKAMLAQPGITWHGNMPVLTLRRHSDHWQVLDAQEQVLAQAARVVVCAGFGSHELLRRALPLQALRGQLSWGWRSGVDDAAFPDTPVNGNGNFIPQVPTEQGMAWYLGSSFERDCTDTRVREADHQGNYAKLQTLLPQTAQALAPSFEQAQIQSFTAVRCTAPDRLPVVGAIDAVHLPGLWLSTAMGARGLSLALLCAELLAAQWHGEPWPLEKKLAQALAPDRRSLISTKAVNAPNPD
jgi:tRNA 5-methylaminomethyl-2-thiouridine biosynthesis bifunctional protein